MVEASVLRALFKMVGFVINSYNKSKTFHGGLEKFILCDISDSVGARFRMDRQVEWIEITIFRRGKTLPLATIQNKKSSSGEPHPLGWINSCLSDYGFEDRTVIPIGLRLEIGIALIAFPCPHVRYIVSYALLENSYSIGGDPEDDLTIRQKLISKSAANVDNVIILCHRRSP